MDIEINIPSFKSIREEAKRIKTESGKVIDRAIKDVCVRGPSQVTKAVTGAYGIKSSEVTRAGKSAKGGAKIRCSSYTLAHACRSITSG